MFLSLICAASLGVGTTMECVSVIGVVVDDRVVVGCVLLVAVNSTLGVFVAMAAAGVAIHGTVLCWWRSVRCGSLSAPVPGSPRFCMIGGQRCV